MEMYSYETKCRRCGSFQEWDTCKIGEVKWETFLLAIEGKMQFPELAMCEHCKKKTVQDVVSYTDYPG